MLESGWIKLYRKLQKWEWYQDSKMVHLFIHMMFSANREPKKWRGTEIERGSFVTSLKTLSLETGISVQSLRTCIKRLKSTNEIDERVTNLWRIITIRNYDDYNPQDIDANRQSTSEPTINQQTTNNQSTINQQQLEKDKKDKKDKNIYTARTAKRSKQYRITFDYETKIINGITNEDLARWGKAYPSVTIKEEILRAKEWMINNPRKRKKDVGKFLTNWFLRQQEYADKRNGQGRQQKLDLSPPPPGCKI